MALEENIRDAGFKEDWSQQLQSFLSSLISGVGFDGPGGAGQLPLNQDHGVGHALWLACPQHDPVPADGASLS